MNLLEKFEKLNNRLTNLLEENKELKQQYKNLQEENQELKEKFNERDYKNIQEENEELKERLEERNKQYQQHVLNLEKQKNEHLELKRQYKNLQEDNRKFQQHVLNLEKQKSEHLELKRQYKNLQEENKNLKEKLNERDKQFQQHIQNLEKQKSEELEIISQNLEKTLGKLELDELSEYDTKIFKEKNKSLIDDDIKDKEFIQFIEDSPGSIPLPSKYKSNEHSYNSFNKDCIRVVVGLDFGTTYSGFSYCHVNNLEEIHTNNEWPGERGTFKTNTVLQYDEYNNNVELWGFPALAKKPNRRNNRKNKKPVELFKLHLGGLSEDLKPNIEVDYKKAITDYLREIGKVIKEKIATSWHDIYFFEHVLLVLTVPAEYTGKDIAVMRECVHCAGLIKEKDSENLQFTTEPEAAAVYCIDAVGPDPIGSNFMVVDCGGGTVDLTTRKLLKNNSLGEITERAGDFCGSTYIDVEFIEFLGRKLGKEAIDILKENYYGQLQYMVQKFCRRAKLPFTGDQSKYEPYELDIEDDAPSLKQYVNEEVRNIMEENEWIIDIKFNDIKAMFDSVVEKIIKLIHSQLSNTQEKCSTIFLVGGFSESRYLQQRIKKEFQQEVKNISVPLHPIIAAQHGAVKYGLSLRKNSVNNNMKINRFVISSRILKYTYGVIERNYWMQGDPISRKLRDGRIDRFHRIVERGTRVEVNQKINKIFTPLSPLQTRTKFSIYFTRQYDARYCDEPGVELLGNLIVHLPGSGHLDRLLFEFTLGEMEIAVAVKNKTNGQQYMTTFSYGD